MEQGDWVFDKIESLQQECVRLRIIIREQTKEIVELKERLNICNADDARGYDSLTPDYYTSKGGS